MKSELHIPFKEALRKEDSETQTYGCRVNNPDICRYYMLDSVCAYARENHICLQPSRAWKRMYMKLKESSDERI